MKRRFLDLAAAGILLGVVQALAETAALALLHRDLLLPPYAFFPTHLYDAFTKLYFLAAERMPLPGFLGHFLAQGVVAKGSLLPDLLAVNVGVAVVVASVLAPLGSLLGVGRSESSTASLRRAVAVVALACAAVHLAAWAASFAMPAERSLFKIVRAIVRDFVQGGVLVSLAVLGAAWVAAGLVAGTRRAHLAAAAIAALMVPALALGRGASEADAVAKSAPSAGDVAPAQGYNVVLVSIDSLRADRLGVYGHDRDTSPTIDDWARRGTRFQHCVSTTSWTLPAHMSLLTGRSLLGHGVVSDDRRLPASVPTLAEAFSTAGYRTHAIVSAPYVNSRYGFARGFDDYDDRTIFFATNEDSYRSVTAPLLVEAAKGFLGGQSATTPFFLFLHFWDVHYDYAPGAPYDTMFDADYEGEVTGENFYFDDRIRDGMNERDLEHLLALYDGEVRLVDDHLALIRDELARLGLADRTVIAVTSDHGDEFFEHGNKGHHRTLYQESIAVPWVLFVPGWTPAEREWSQEVGIADIGPTLLGLAGLPAMEGAEGRDLSAALTGSEPFEQRPVFAELYRSGTRNVQVAELAERAKIIHHFQRRSLETYDLAVDAGEQQSLSPRSPAARQLAARLRTWLDGRWKTFDKRRRSEGIDPVILDERTTEQLRSLGYLQ